MRQVAILSVVAALMLQAAQADIVRHRFIPEDLRGQWMEVGTRAQTARTVINLSAAAYLGPRASCSVDWVSQTAGRRGSIYAAHIQCIDPLAQADIKALGNLIIRPLDGDEIEVGPDFESLRIFRRCSASCGPGANRNAQSVQPTTAAE